MTTPTATPLAERGTAGLLQFIATGSDRLFSARKAKALKVFRSRNKSADAAWLFSEVASDERADRLGHSKPILSPLARLEAVKRRDPSAYHHAKAV